VGPQGGREPEGALQAPADLEQGEAVAPDHGLGEDPGKRSHDRDQRIECWYSMGMRPNCDLWCSGIS
jgi:hypothetical protein